MTVSLFSKTDMSIFGEGDNLRCQQYWGVGVDVDFS